MVLRPSSTSLVRVLIRPLVDPPDPVFPRLLIVRRIPYL